MKGRLTMKALASAAVAAAIMGGAAAATAQCAPAPVAGCVRPTVALGSKLRFKQSPSHPTIQWGWARGPQVPLAQLGAPETGADSYTLCIYDTGALVSTLDIPGGADWSRRPGPSGQDLLRYKPSKPYAPHGVKKLNLHNKAGGAAKFTFQASDSLLPMPPMPVTTPEDVVLQLTNSAGGCWEANFTAAHPISVNTAQNFKAKGD
ncbi:MAG TPA: hypothetical protein VGC36_15780 [Rhizomicrobium sp.]